MCLTFVFLLLSLGGLALAGTVTYDWSIDWVTAAPDGFSRQVIGINGAWPCPPIEATVGDTVVINVYNNLGSESTGIHFHGLSQTGTQVMDGPSGVTQCPIPPGSHFTYSFQIDSPGSYWYHSHNKGQYPDGLRGPIVVHDPADPYAGQYDEEFVLTTSDWYHDTVPVLLQQLLSPSNTIFLPPFPDALLLNDSQNVTFQFTAGKTYKIDIISMAALASTFIQFDSHTMRVIGVDGTYIQQHDAYQIRVAPAQRYTVLLNAQPTTRRNYAFLASLDENRDYLNDANPVYPFNVTGYLVYDDTKPLPGPYIVNQWSIVNDFTFVALDDQALLGTPDVEITLNFAFCLDSGGIPRACFNNISYVPQKVPSLFTALSTGPSNSNPTIYGQISPFIAPGGSIVQLTINNLDAAIHPFHLHGHQFQVCERPSSNSGSFNGHTRNFPAVPMRRDTVAVNPRSYAVVRFVADNPGVWLFHCHIEWHVVMGLTATLIEAPESLRGLTIPSDHQAACQAQDIPTSGNAAGNMGNLTDLSGANTVAVYPDYGATYSSPQKKRGVARVRRGGEVFAWR
ncbi:Ferroxidase [Hyaloscypha variabilis F]|uniref:Ferroxidase n=1 Tax=Hyaloscypha variabilis (strain UAMH 11265 / GT02V1 / F) TaxID=1149755 RepID=A0A2J6RFA9_HYAVF|nr:Ferroxidase [Hyaloscypha variabilis F]